MSFTLLIENDMNLYVDDLLLEEDRTPVTDAELLVHLGELPAIPQQITAASNATPIVVTSAAHGLANGSQVLVSQVRGNDAANGLWTVANVTTNTFELSGSEGSGDYFAGGVWYRAVDGAVSIELDYVAGSRATYRGTLPRENNIVAGRRYVAVIGCVNYGV